MDNVSDNTQAQSEIAVPSNCNWKNIVSRVGTSLALFGTVITLIFVFLIGFNVNNMAILSQIGSITDVNLDGGVSIYDYFYKVYKQIVDLTDGMSSNPLLEEYNFTAIALYLPAVICTVIAAGSIVAVATLGIIAIIKLIRKLMGYETANAERFAFAAFLTYVLGAALLRSFNIAAINATYATVSSSTNMPVTVTLSVALDYSPATVAGIVIGAVSMGAYLACHVATRGAALKGAKTIVTTSLTAVCLAFVGIVTHYASGATLAMDVQGSGLVTAAMSANMFFQACGANIGLTTELWQPDFFILLLTMIMQLVVIGIAVALMIVQTLKIIKNKDGSSLVLSILLAVACFDYFVMAVVNSVRAMNAETESVTLTFVPCVVALIFGLLNLGVTITRRALEKTNKPRVAATEAVETTAE